MNRQDVYQAVTDRIVAAIEEGEVAPWRKPWIGGGPVNVRTGKPYRGINVILLGITPYGDPRWGTFKACKETAVAHARSQGREIVEKLDKHGRVVYREVVDGEEIWFGGGVRKGEKSTSVILWKPVKKKSQTDEEKEDKYLLLKQYPVFNVEQCDEMPPLPKEREHVADQTAEAIANGYSGPSIAGGSIAAYSPTIDMVTMPKPELFESGDAYYSTLFHELLHSTGHKDRLDRLESTGFGTGPYAKEELVAEMGAAMLCGVSQIDNLDQSASYVSGWLERLTNDPKLVVQAAAQAQRGADLILGTTFEETTNDEEAAVAAA